MAHEEVSAATTTTAKEAAKADDAATTTTTTTPAATGGGGIIDGSHSGSSGTTTTTTTATTTTVTPSAAEDENGYYPEEEVTTGNWTTPQVEVHEVKVQTGEEEEEVFWKHRSKLYRWLVTRRGQTEGGGEGGDEAAAAAEGKGGGGGASSSSSVGGEWKERGLGEAKLLRHKTTGRVRFLLRQEKTLKVVANHYVVQTDVFCKLTPNVGSDKIWVWTVPDASEDDVKTEQFALKFGQVEQATLFKEKFEEAVKLNNETFGLTSKNEEEEEENNKKKEKSAKTESSGGEDEEEKKEGKKSSSSDDGKTATAASG